MEKNSCIKPILDRIELELSILKTFILNKNKGIKFWLRDLTSSTAFHCKKFPNWLKVLLSGVLSLIILSQLNFIVQIIGDKTVTDKTGFWTLFSILVSSPVAFTIWHFRDQNATQQIENARKDTNLKEFQKLAEWVSGAHLIEDKFIEKTPSTSTAHQEKEIEITREYTDIPRGLSIPTYSKKDGAVGLQIAAVYNLLPFYRGEYGESFKKPALNLLTSAWLALQQKELEKLSVIHLQEDESNLCQIIAKLQNNARSPLGIAITRVLLSLNLNGELCLLEHPEIFPNLVLAGMDFHLEGLDKKVLDLFQSNFNYKSINLVGATLVKANLQGALLMGAQLQYADLDNANFKKSTLIGVNLKMASLQNTNFQNSDLRWSQFEKDEYDLEYTKFLETADFTGAKNLDKAIGLPPEIIAKYGKPKTN
ncbi:pentapeptide repeat-containing protein [Otariodibacter oris]|uniref:Pentapeptide repeat protein n=1 Tax=Otariodibacter oris TaxID=1032623 RepID=A0A420XGJ3_9PAST|nr:pentapeptide repeat-containing protein [Otariodibacter oris]QGM80101.1 hypothetical protein A6A10_01080 [Otariodibacter oris]RKR71928.1 pentapeptide repeat protein [Otariodibacter oris]